jgi:hypothetical protein
MTADALPTCRSLRRWAFVLGVAGLFALAGCKSGDKETKGAGVSRGKDPLVYGPTRIPKQDLPVPDRATGPRVKTDPLTTPTGGKAGYTDDPDRFKGTFVPGKTSTPAALAARRNDGEELKIESPGVPLTPAGGTSPAGVEPPPAGVEPMFAQLEKYGVKREDRSLAREGGRWVFRAALPISNTGARRQYTGAAETAPEAVKQVVDQIAVDPK